MRHRFPAAYISTWHCCQYRLVTRNGTPWVFTSVISSRSSPSRFTRSRSRRMRICRSRMGTPRASRTRCSYRVPAWSAGEVKVFCTAPSFSSQNRAKVSVSQFPITAQVSDAPNHPERSLEAITAP